MTARLDNLRLRLPEFNLVSDAMAEAFLASAATLLDEATLGKGYEEAVLYRAAHSMAIAPVGKQAGLSGERYDSRYLALYNMLIRSACGGFRICT